MVHKNVPRPWALKRRIVYGFGFLCLVSLIVGGTLYGVLHEPATCFDGMHNGDERGRDCGGICVRICTVDVIPPKVRWVESFRIAEGRYNAVAYIENANDTQGTARLRYTFTLSDGEGVIAERQGETELPPGVTYPIFEGPILTGDRIPTRTEITFDEDPVWVYATQNGERYVTERRELTGADKKPVITAILKNESRVEAQDVDVVATIFNSQGIPLTASRTKVSLFPPGSAKQVTFTWQEPIAKTIRTCEVPTDVIVAIDLSGSMNNDGGDPPEPVTSVLTAARNFVLTLNKGDQAGLVTFATNAETAIGLTQNRDEVGALIRTLEIKPESEQGSTNTGEALVHALNELESERKNENARRAVVLLTDGLATAPDPEPENFARVAAENVKSKNIELFTIGLGTELNESFLLEIATDSKHYFRAPTTQTLGNIYETITTALCEEGAAVIDIVAKPQGTYQQL